SQGGQAQAPDRARYSPLSPAPRSTRPCSPRSWRAESAPAEAATTPGPSSERSASFPPVAAPKEPDLAGLKFGRSSLCEQHWPLPRIEILGWGPLSLRDGSEGPPDRGGSSSQRFRSRE